MTGSAFLRGRVARFTARAFVLAILIATLTTIPSTTRAANRDQLGDPGGGGGRGYIVPGHGDDDQPTIVTPTPRRTVVQTTEPDAQGGGGTVGAVRTTSRNPAQRFFVRSRDLLRRLFFVP